ncbi:MAG: hypothetical protein ACRCX2_27380 [Paraclostridium sp.]
MKTEIEKITELLKEKKNKLVLEDIALSFDFLGINYILDFKIEEMTDFKKLTKLKAKKYLFKKDIGVTGISKVYYPVASDLSYERLLDKIKMYLDGEVETKLTAEEFRKVMEEGE